MSNIPKYDLPTLYSNHDQYLVKAQHDLELAIVAYGEAGDIHAERHREYRERKAMVIKRLREDKQPATVILDLAQGEVAQYKEAELSAEYNAKRCKMVVDAIQERINMLKFIARSCNQAQQ